ncbi:MAG: GIY-YIG nuclease family protein [Endomicrobia bacterium]|nr:GIY-YIG nuclease family protein [Endomicrobiia bacterium]
MTQENIKLQLSYIPKLPGVYIMRDSSAEILYIGKAKNLYNRIRAYFVENKDTRLIGLMLYNVKSIEYIVCRTEKESLVLEQRLIKDLQPRYNIIWRDDKSYFMLQVDTSDLFPKINFLRYKDYLKSKKNDKFIKYFGPYPSSKQIRSIVKFVNKYFKLRRCKYDSQMFLNAISIDRFLSCIYLQTKQCVAPCVVASDKSKLKEIIDEYKMLLRGAILFLEGKSKKLIEKLKQQIKAESKKLNFEQAIILRDTLKYISNMLTSCTILRINESDITKLTVGKLEVLKKLKEKFKLNSLPVIIDAIDISTFYGSGSCGSVVRFLNGLPDKSNYRRYKIKNINEGSVNDYSMMREVLFRRFKRLLDNNETLPNLLVIDGGFGHLNIAKDILKEFSIDDRIDIIAIAKKEEKVYSLNNNVVYNLSDEEDNLIKQIRDEAHRFAIKYNRLLFRKKMI